MQMRSNCAHAYLVAEVAYCDIEHAHVAELMDADEVIVSSSGSFCLVADEIDGKPVGGKAPELIDILQKYLVKEFIDATTV